MEKSNIVHHLALPRDTINHICSFIFYQEIDVVIRNVEKKNIVLNECKHVRKEIMQLFQPNVIGLYYILPRGNQLIVSTLCRTCGNYVKPIQKTFICQCLN